MILYAVRFLLVAARGYRLRPWRSPYIKWRIETYSGIPAEEVTAEVFWKFLWSERRSLWRFLRWGAELKTLEKRLKAQS